MKKTRSGFLRIATALIIVMASQGAEVDGVRHVGGLPGVKNRAAGRLVATDKGIAFEEGGATTFVDATRIVKLSTDDERYMKGGASGLVVRAGVPFAGSLGIGLSGLSQWFGGVPFVFGVLASAVMQSRADLVTVEYFDPHDGYRGAVFMMPWHAAEEIKAHVVASGAQVDSAHNACPATTTYPRLMTMLPVSSQGAEVPDAYRVLTYEHVFGALQRKASGWQVRRLGDSNSLEGCDEWKLALTVEAFRKGNAAERAMTGPLGQFVGTTSISCRVVLSNSRGESLLDAKVKAAIHGDRESLDLGDVISKMVSRKVQKVVARSLRLSEAD